MIAPSAGELTRPPHVRPQDWPHMSRYHQARAVAFHERQVAGPARKLDVVVDSLVAKARAPIAEGQFEALSSEAAVARRDTYLALLAEPAVAQTPVSEWPRDLLTCARWLREWWLAEGKAGRDPGPMPALVNAGYREYRRVKDGASGSRQELWARRVVEAGRLAAAGCTLPDAARLMGVKAEALERTLSRVKGGAAVARALAANSGRNAR